MNEALQHTKEPWSINEWTQPDSSIAIGATGTPLIARVILRDVSINEQKANARRIVACVNACKGIPNEQLEMDNAAFITTFNERNTFKRQRDGLIEGIRRMLDENGHLADGDVCTLKRLKGALLAVGVDWEGANDV